MALERRLELLREVRLKEDWKPLYEMSLGEARRADLEAIRSLSGSGEPVEAVNELEIAGPGGVLPMRLYRARTEGRLPTFVYFYGGGWTLGQIDTADAICRALVNRVGCAALVPGYRRAPEHPFPAAVYDCFEAVRWLGRRAGELGLDARRMALVGDSAGGNLAAVVAQLARGYGEVDIAGQVLIYPNTDLVGDFASMREMDERAFFNRHSARWYAGHYLSDPDSAFDPLASPLRAASLVGLPPALVITAEHDPLRDEGERYAERLRREGVSVEMTRYGGVVHGFVSMANYLDAGKEAIEQIAGFLRRQLG